MANRLFMTGLALCASLAMQGCGVKNSEAKAAADGKAQRGNAEILRNKQIRSDLAALNVTIEKPSSEQDAFIVQEVRTSARLLTDQDLQRVQSLLNEYITNAADILSIVNTPGITYSGDTWALARYAANARAALHEIDDEARARSQSTRRVSH